MRTRRFNLIDQARIALVAALLGAGVTAVAVGATDPFGKSDRAARHAAEVVLCTQLAAVNQRLSQLNGHIQEVGFNGLTRNERDVWELQQASHGRLLMALNKVKGECFER